MPPSPPPPLTAHPALPRWRLAALAVAVLAVHAVLLRAAATRFELGASRMSPAHPVVLPPMQTRRIETMAPPPAVTRPAPAAPARAVARKRPAPPQQPTAPVEMAPSTGDSPAALPVATVPVDTPVALPQTPPSAAVASAPTDTEPPPATAINLPESTVLTYKMTGSAKGLDYHANAELVWHHEGSRYDARMTVSVMFLGTRSMSSVGEVGPDGLAPTRFTDKSRSEYAAHFERDKGQITFSANTPPAPWVRGAQDRVSVFLQLGGLLAGSPAAYPAGTTVAVYTAGPRAADTWTFRVEPEETLILPLGEVRTVKLVRQPLRDYDQRVEVWLAPALGYLPVRNKITQGNGDFIDQQLSALARP